jgi:hypothetical protein
MKLTFFVPTFRTGVGPYAAILNVCSFAGPEIEVVVRDNSGDAAKQQFLSRFRSEHCHIHSVPTCTPYENLKESVKLTHGEFIVGVSDDDFFDPMAVPPLLKKVSEIIDDPSYAGVSGDIVYSSPQGSPVMKMLPLEDQSAARRYANHTLSGANLLWSAHRRVHYLAVMSFIKDLPVELSFHDMMFNVLMLMLGKYANAERILYIQDLTHWATLETGHSIDRQFLVNSGIDPSAHRAHWMICLFEGSKIIIDSPLVRHIPEEERYKVARVWCLRWMENYKGSYLSYPPPATPLSRTEENTMRICARWYQGTELSMDQLFTDIVEIFTMSNPVVARTYYDYWSNFGKQNAA